MRDFYDKMESAKAKKGGLTPFLGAIASSVKDDRSNIQTDMIWGDVIKRINNLKILSKDKIGYGKNKIDNFFNEFSENHSIKISDETKKVEPNKFDNWRLKLLELIFLFTDSFSEQVSIRGVIPTNLLYEINTIKDEQRVFDLIKELIESDISNKYLEEKNTQAILFPKTKINEKLNFLLCRIVKKDDVKKKYPSLFKCKASTNECMFSDQCGKKDITSGEIRWLKELLWWALRFDIPIYPNSSELAHYLSYYIEPKKHQDVRDNDLMKVAEVINKKNRNVYDESLVSLFKEIRSNRKNIENLESSEISHLLIKNITKYIFSEDNSNPLVVTTNYDTMVEDAFDIHIMDSFKNDEKKGYEVIFPVIISKNQYSYTSRDIEWICKRCYPNAGESEPKVVYCKIRDKKIRENKLPILLKLHGNPTNNIIDIRKGIKKQSISVVMNNIRHFMVLTESDYLKSLFLKLDEYEITDILFGIPRSYWFLGYSISDWNVRAIIYQNYQKFRNGNALEKKDKKNQENDSNKKNQENDSNESSAKVPDYNILVHTEDTYGEAFLKNLNIAPYRVSINEFQKQLNEN